MQITITTIGFLSQICMWSSTLEKKDTVPSEQGRFKQTFAATFVPAVSATSSANSTEESGCYKSRKGLSQGRSVARFTLCKVLLSTHHVQDGLWQSQRAKSRLLGTQSWTERPSGRDENRDSKEVTMESPLCTRTF